MRKRLIFMCKGLKGLAIFFPCFILFTSTALAKIIQVPSQYTTIQDGIDAAVGGDTVLVAAGIYTGIGNRDIEFLGKEICLKSEFGPAQTIINSEGAITDRHRAFLVHEGEDSNTIIDGFKITGGVAPPGLNVYQHNSGGGFYIWECSPKIINCILAGNVGSSESDPMINFGGGIAMEGSAPIIRNCSFTENYAANGGAIYGDWDSKPIIDSCAFSGNSADAVEVGTAHLTNSQVFDNIGKGIRCRGGYIHNCHFDKNALAAYCNYDTLIISGCEIRNQTSGGVICDGSDDSYARLIIDSSYIYNTDGIGISTSFSNILLTNSAFYNNSNVMKIMYSSADLHNCTLAGNKGDWSGTMGSAVTVTFSSLSGTGCILAFNTGGPAIYCIFGTATLSCSDVYGNQGGDWTDCLAGQGNTLNNFSNDPLFCNIATGDFGLLDGSPCLTENSPCGYLVGAFGAGCSSAYPVATNINFGPMAHGNIVQTGTPEIYWSYYDTASTTQLKHQIQVGTDDDWSSAELWDSEPVVSSDTDAVYAGLELGDHIRYYLRIRVCNSLGWGDWCQSNFITQLIRVIHVPSQKPNMQSAVDYSLPGDTILVSDGIYSGPGNYDILISGMPLTIKSENGPAFTSIDCGGSQKEYHRAFYVHDNTENTVNIEGFTIKNGFQDDGGVIRVTGGDVNLGDCVFYGNKAQIGAVCSYMEGYFEVNRCTFVGNTATSESLIEYNVITLGVGANLLVDNSIIAFNNASSISCGMACEAATECSDIYGNTKGDWIDCIADQYGIYNNFSDNPLFCDTAHHDYNLQENSPCIMGTKVCNSVIGALNVGCEILYICGDANNDDHVNVSDAVYIINYVFSGGNPPNPIESGDANCDSSANISDAVWIINHVFAGGHTPCDTNGDGIPDC